MLNFSVFIPLVFSIFFATITTIIAYPGIWTWDAIHRYQEILGIKPLTTHFTLLLTYAWWLLLSGLKYPGFILVFDQILFWGAITLFSYAAFKTIKARLVVITALGLCPPLYIWSVTISSDNVMVSLMLLAVSFIALYIRSRRVLWLIFCLIPLVLATAIRYNAITGAFPLIVLVAIFYIREQHKTITFSFYKVVALTLLFLTMPAMLSFFLNSTAIQKPQLGTIFVWDMAVISVIEHTDVIPDYLQYNKDNNMIQLVKTFNKNSNVPTFSVVSYLPPKGYTEYSAIIKPFIKSVLRFPSAYLSHRFHVFLTLLSFGKDIYFKMQPWMQPNTYGIKFNYPSLVRVYFYESICQIPLFRVYWYFLVDLFICIFLSLKVYRYRAIKELEELSLTTSLSGLTMELPLFVFAPACDYRYSLWVVCSALLSLLLMIASRYSRKEIKI